MNQISCFLVFYKIKFFTKDVKEKKNKQKATQGKHINNEHYDMVFDVNESGIIYCFYNIIFMDCFFKILIVFL